uniref:Uncharacterized protein n=1 Tax=Cajanus cajan TaxID=3821 RepID=A0A151RD56_CAJCA|nr:hypothetical protein KK1_038206 [Cajanus cajan]
MAMNLIIPLLTLIHQRQLEESPNIGPVASERYEDGNVHGIVLGVLAIRVEIDGPIVATDAESVAHDVLPRTHPFRQRITLYRELVRAVHRFADRTGARRTLGEGLEIPHLLLLQFRHRKP